MKPGLVSIRTRAADGQVTDQFGVGDPIRIEVTVEVDAVPSDYNIQIGFEDHLGTRLFTVATNLSASRALTVSGRRTVVGLLDELPLAPGRYALTPLLGPVYKPASDVIDQAMWINVAEQDYFGNGRLPHPSEGRVLVRSDWSVAETGGET
jgi:hypothetical protein